jgi:hypothetical protein
MEKALADQQFDEISLATLPRHLSRWLRADLPHRAERPFGLPVTTIITRRWPCVGVRENPDITLDRQPGPDQRGDRRRAVPLLGPSPLTWTAPIPSSA